MTSVPPRLAPLLAPDSPVQQLATRLVDAGHECYLVGGSVRDAFLDRAAPDVDLATDARPDAIERLVRGWAEHVWLQGARFGTVGGLAGGRGRRDGPRGRPRACGARAVRRGAGDDGPQAGLTRRRRPSRRV
jgi:hypothetical protein